MFWSVRVNFSQYGVNINWHNHFERLVLHHRFERLVLPTKIKHRLKTQQFPFQIYSSRNAYTCALKDKSENVHGIFIPNSLQLEKCLYPAAVSEMNKLSYGHTVESCATRRENKPLYAITWVDRPNIKRKERSQTQRNRYKYDYNILIFIKTSKANLWC